MKEKVEIISDEEFDRRLAEIDKLPKEEQLPASIRLFATTTPYAIRKKLYEGYKKYTKKHRQ